MDFHVLGSKGGAHVMTTHRGQEDETPLQLISAQEIARIKALEAAVRGLAALLPAEDIPAPG